MVKDINKDFFSFSEDDEKENTPRNNQPLGGISNDPVDFADSMFKIYKEKSLDSIIIYIFDYKKGKKNTSKSYGMIEWSPDPMDFDNYHLPTLIRKRFPNIPQGRYFIIAKSPDYSNLGEAVIDVEGDNSNDRSITPYSRNKNEIMQNDFTSNDIPTQMKKTIDKETYSLMNDLLTSAFKSFKDGMVNMNNPKAEKLQVEILELKKLIEQKQKADEDDKFEKLQKTMKDQVDAISDTYNKQVESLVQELESQKLESKKKKKSFDLAEIIKTVEGIKPLLNMLNINPFDNKNQNVQGSQPAQKTIGGPLGDLFNIGQQPSQNRINNDTQRPPKLNINLGNVEEPDFTGLGYNERNSYGGNKMSSDKDNFKVLADRILDEILQIITESSDDENEIFKNTTLFFKENFLVLAAQAGFQRRELMIDVVKNPDEFVNKVINNIPKTMLKIAEKSIPDITNKIKSTFKMSILDVVSEELKKVK